MHEMQTIVSDVRGVCPSVCLSRDSTVCGAFVQPLPNYFGLLLKFLLGFVFGVISRSLFARFSCQ